MSATPMLFRFDKYGIAPECTALIPDAPANPGRVVCYAHVGQHGEADRAWVRQRTRPATARERAALVREMARIYGPIRIIRRMPAKRGGAA